MKKLLLVFVLVPLFIIASKMNGSAEDLIYNSSIQFQEKSIDVVFDTNSYRLSFRIIQESSIGAKEIVQMEMLVKQLTKEIGTKIALADGYSLIYDGGYPMWGPYSFHDTHNLFACLIFSEKVWMNGKEIHFRGESQKPIGHYPYFQ
jgi:hypothetical protein